MSECLISMRGGSGDNTLYKLPKIDSSYSQNIIIDLFDNDNETIINSSVILADVGVPDTYDIKWYFNGSLLEGQQELSVLSYISRITYINWGSLLHDGQTSLSISSLSGGYYIRVHNHNGGTANFIDLWLE